MQDQAHILISTKKNSKEGPRFKVYPPNQCEEAFVIKKVKNTIPWSYAINDLYGKDIVGTVYEKEQRKTNQEQFRIEKAIKKKQKSYMSNGKIMIIPLIVVV